MYREYYSDKFNDSVTLMSYLYDISDGLKKFGFVIIFSLLFVCLIGWVLPSSPQNEAYEVKLLYAINNENSTDSLNYLDISGGNIKYITNSYKDGKKMSILQIIGKSSIIEGEYDEPYLEIYKGKFEHEWYWLFGIDLRGFFGIDNYYIFYIPQGSVIYE